MGGNVENTNAELNTGIENLAYQDQNQQQTGYYRKGFVKKDKKLAVIQFYIIHKGRTINVKGI